MNANHDAARRLEFDLLYATLSEIQRSLLDSVTKVAGFFLLATGWLATSASAREFLQQQASVRQTAVLAVLGVTLLFVYLCWSAYAASRRIFGQLMALALVPAGALAFRRVTGAALVAYVAANGFLASLVVVALMRLGPIT